MDIGDGDFFSCLTDKRQPNAPTDPPPAFRRTPRLEEVQQSMTEVRQTIAVITTVRKSNKNSLERQVDTYR